MLHTAPRSPAPAQDKDGLDVLLVAGPSGGGKSTFIQCLSACRLGSDILRELPEGCASWPVVEANDMLKRSVPLADMLAAIGPASGAILHYDITYIHRFAMSGYESDPASELFGLAGRLSAILVKTDLERLTRQYLARHSTHVRSKSRAALLWGDWVRRPLRQRRFRRQGRPAVDTEQLYLDPGFLPDCYTAWEAYVRRLADGKPDFRILTIEPDRQVDGLPAFRLVSAVHAGGARG